jgi:hypothetical protein
MRSPGQIATVKSMTEDGLKPTRFAPKLPPFPEKPRASDGTAEAAALRREVTRLTSDLAVLRESLTALRHEVGAASGVLARLAPGANAHDAGLVCVSASDADPDERWAARNAAGPGPAPFVSDDAPGQWLCIDFRALAVTPTAYVLRAVRGAPGSAHPRGWVVEASDDGAQWTEIDRRSDNAQLNAADAVAVFEVAVTAVARRVRIRQTQTNHAGNNVLAIASFDVIGALARAVV